MGRLFGTDGVRGIANSHPMTAEMALKIGMAVGKRCRRDQPSPRVVVGRDTRLSGGMIESALVAGLCAMGADALVAGTMPTPGIAFLTVDLHADAGVVISASHNPYEDNGIKIFSRTGYKLPDEIEDEIEMMVASSSLAAEAAPAAEIGTIHALDDAAGRYRAFLRRTFPPRLDLSGLKLVLDCANGATHCVAPGMFRELGADVSSCFTSPDGRNINRDCGSQHTEALSREVVNRRADLGLAFDGDGDRVIAIDETGSRLTGDQILLICARALQQEGRLRNDLVVTTAMSNLGFKIALRELGISHVEAKVGDRHVLEEMIARGAVVGGEESGHMIFLEHHTTGDGILSALQVLGVMRQQQKKLSELNTMQLFPQQIVNVEVRHKPALESLTKVAAGIREAEEKLGQRGRVVVRYSGTQPLCRVMVEGPTAEETAHWCQRIADIIKAEIG
jgi:phosphoglucosamine mutase